MLVSVCVPVYNGSGTIANLVERVAEIFAKTPHELEVVLVNDGSRDESDAVCGSLAERYAFVTYVCLRRNYGEHNAVMCALNHSGGDVAVIIDDDFQNPPEEILTLVAEAEKGYDVVYSKYKKKKHAFYRNLGSKFNDVMATFLLKKPGDLYLSSFKAIARPVIDEIIKYKGPFPYVDGLILRVTDSITSVFVTHDARKTGKSNYTIGKLVSLWLNMFINFSIKPLRIISLVGILTSLASFAMFAMTIVERMENPDLPAGWATITSVALFIGGLQLFALGLIGEYVGKAYLDINGTPQWTIRKVAKKSRS